MMKISINSPSYKRPDRVEVLKYIPSAMVWVCESEFETYGKHIKKKNLVPVKKGIQGNVCRIRNHILDSEFGRGIDAVCIVDDDLEYMGYHKQCQKVRMGQSFFLNWLRKYTEIAEQFEARLWGVNLNQDKQSYREYTPFSLTSVVLGPFSVHLKNPIRYDVRFPLKEDYDLAIQHLAKFRKVLRLNKFFYVCRQGGSGTGQAGGCAVYRNMDREIAQLKLLQKKWGRRIVRYDCNPRSHNTKKVRQFDVNPVIKVPISGV